jgi:two-component system chemotaxis sensor kinase CheA
MLKLFPFLIVRLNEKLLCENQTRDLTDKYVVIVGIGYDKVGLVVDNLLGQEEIVIKSLGEYLGSIKGIAGATIRGDGKVIMILDIETLIRNV